MIEKRQEILARLLKVKKIHDIDFFQQLNKLHEDIDLHKVENMVDTLKKENEKYDFLIFQKINV